MPPEIAVWLNRIGLGLGIVSFFLAAPEILGQHKLNAIENKIESVLLPWPIVLRVLLREDDYSLRGWVQTLIVGPVFSSLVGFPLIVIVLALTNFRPLLFWPSVGIGLVAIVLSIGFIEAGPRILAQLSDDTRFRQRCLICGAVFFLIGSILQCAATF
jgi:hypothetical protein